MSTFLISVLALLVVLGVLVFVHEAGHFLAAKSAGIYVHRFSLGLGPPVKALSFGKGETEYVVSWLPLGGYVKMASREEEVTSSAARGRQGHGSGSSRSRLRGQTGVEEDDRDPGRGSDEHPLRLGCVRFPGGQERRADPGDNAGGRGGHGCATGVRQGLCPTGKRRSDRRGQRGPRQFVERYPGHASVLGRQGARGRSGRQGGKSRRISRPTTSKPESRSAGQKPPPISRR